MHPAVSYTCSDPDCGHELHLCNLEKGLSSVSPFESTRVRLGCSLKTRQPPGLREQTLSGTEASHGCVGWLTCKQSGLRWGVRAAGRDPGPKYLSGPSTANTFGALALWSAATTGLDFRMPVFG